MRRNGRFGGETKPQKSDGIHRAALRGASTHWRHRAEVVARELAGAGVEPEPGKGRVLETRRAVARGWSEVAADLVIQGQVQLARPSRAAIRGWHAAGVD
jgi:hypothetical protein